MGEPFPLQPPRLGSRAMIGAKFYKRCFQENQVITVTKMNIWNCIMCFVYIHIYISVLLIKARKGILAPRKFSRQQWQGESVDLWRMFEYFNVSCWKASCNTNSSLNPKDAGSFSLILFFLCKVAGCFVAETLMAFAATRHARLCHVLAFAGIAADEREMVQ